MPPVPARSLSHSDGTSLSRLQKNEDDVQGSPQKGLHVTMLPVRQKTPNSGRRDVLLSKAYAITLSDVRDVGFSGVRHR
jgi:hypothetical protein